MCVDRTQRRSNTNAFILKANNVHDDKYDYSKVIYTGAHEDITIICKKHGDFEQTASNHLQEHGCSGCCSAGFSKMSIKWLEHVAKIDKIKITMYSM